MPGLPDAADGTVHPQVGSLIRHPRDDTCVLALIRQVRHAPIAEKKLLGCCCARRVCCTKSHLALVLQVMRIPHVLQYFMREPQQLLELHPLLMAVLAARTGSESPQSSDVAYSSNNCVSEMTMLGAF